MTNANLVECFGEPIANPVKIFDSAAIGRMKGCVPERLKTKWRPGSRLDDDEVLSSSAVLHYGAASEVKTGQTSTKRCLRHGLGNHGHRVKEQEAGIVTKVECYRVVALVSAGQQSCAPSNFISKTITKPYFRGASDNHVKIFDNGNCPRQWDRSMIVVILQGDGE